MTLIIRSTVAVAIFAFFALSAYAQNQSSQVFITWKASNFYPAHFEGKALPTFGSPVTVAVEISRGGAFLDLSQADITWELDGKFLAGGRNTKEAHFTTTKGDGDTHFIRVTIVRGEESFESSLRIPVRAPSISIDAPYPEGRGSGGSITISALPFFFNVSALSEISFSWLVDGERLAAGNDHVLTISDESLTSARAFQVLLEAQNTRNSSESASRRATLALTP
jgi:hypothetical protein